ncbi:MAG: 16S rRNA (uracil(1498)-N(3))-methyltransferase [Gemmataceae bacterium]|nr:16S rRNA (uracil(1498)-N(3))-methyltransferase [Gemmataceae bacterium]
MSERFYASSPLALGPYLLDGPEARHLATVSRVRVGDAVCLFNGNGLDYHARVVAVGKREVDLDIVSAEPAQRELPRRVEIAAALPKGDRAQFLIEKLTELGVTCFVPLICCRSVVQPGDGKREKLQRYVIEASKQCGRSVLMEIGEPQSLSEYCRTANAEVRWFAHPGAAKAELDATTKSIAGMVGPEGGFTDEEAGAALAAGWTGVGLGARILRVETAAMVVATLAAL